MWTFGRKLAAGFALSWILLVVVGAASYRAIQSLLEANQWVTHTHDVLNSSARILNLVTEAESEQRVYMITGDPRGLDSYTGVESHVAAEVSELRRLTSDNPRQQDRIAEVEQSIAQKLASMDNNVTTRRDSGFEAAAKLVRGGEGRRLMNEVRRVFASIEQEERDLLAVRAQEMTEASSVARATITVGTLVCLVLVSVAGILITRGVTREVGSAIQSMEGSSAELQAAANQQVTGAREQVTAMNQISTTISEFLATSRQIAESSQRVAGIADDRQRRARVDHRDSRAGRPGRRAHARSRQEVAADRRGARHRL
jgi:CHASE3 domain sensor protein